jgi:hypothetical protein
MKVILAPPERDLSPWPAVNLSLEHVPSYRGAIRPVFAMIVHCEQGVFAACEIEIEIGMGCCN